ncbi:hypothetical protein PGH12_17630 [Chryseobacterium wangxinyae]|uniref:hypothetical protein n=1 Tax=Chryseobacterium sp. CY350 TaxID=2997336 RepID=UPI00226E3B04|nr:hypothetical protein [Chryseobacterium sp. CY350]MCY0978181.1 hypothetical protein [Chryseobacterium sp. CY350]WBZ95265.1 hypothetical protein PGH12_17630 [Chryseobacterium sp. CY350]
MDSNKIGIEGEQAVNELAFNTYLKYWCFPNPKDDFGDKKEICDLLICFQNHLLIISIKNYSFKGNYERYFKSTLEKAVSQIHGAERKLLKKNSNVKFSHPETGIFDLNPNSYDSVHRLIININTVPLFHPGGIETKNQEFCHIFNWNSFLGIVNELDTIPDFINYLNKREATFTGKEFIMILGNEEDWDTETNDSFFKYNKSLINENKHFILFSGSELDLLADYFFNERNFSENLCSNGVNGAFIQMDGKWQNYLSRKEVENKKKEDQISYFVDEFVKREVLYKGDSNNIKIATELLSLSRFERRIFGQTFFEFWGRYKEENGYFVARRYGTVNDIVFAMVLHGSNMKHEHIMISMQLAAEGFCVWNNYKSKKIVLICTSNKLTDFKFGMIENIEPFPEEEELEITKNLKVFNWFQNIENIIINFKEYPK